MTDNKKPTMAQTKRGVPLNRRDRVRQVWDKVVISLGRNKFTPWIWALTLAFIMALGTVNEVIRDYWFSYVLGLTVILAVLLGVLLKANLLVLGARPGHSYMGDLALLSMLLVSNALLTKAYHIFLSTVSFDWIIISPAALALGAPFAAAPMLGAVLLGRRTGFSLAIISCFSASFLWPQYNFVLAFFHLVISLNAVYLLQKDKSGRLRLIRTGLLCSLVALPLLLGWAIMAIQVYSNEIWALSMGLLAGPLSGVLATSVVPLLGALGHSTDDRIRAMASLDHPAMRDLMLTAPGTYHHSLVVSSLVEAAAREIGADHLLAKTASLYHDMGKMKKPDYFVENRGNLPNRHDKLAPSMSALILISHAKDGVDLARKYRLSPAIQEIIMQHHGNRVISFFYSKACEACRAAGVPEPTPDDFRYPGPKPQTREAGLVMLADIVEAASRTLGNPTPARLQGLVKQQINTVFSEGQLDECELTLKDLHRIARIFNAILSGIYHHRIEYPEDKKVEEKKTHGDNHKQPAKKASPIHAVPKSADTEDAGLLEMSREHRTVGVDN